MNLERIPYSFILVLILGGLGVDLFVFMTSDTSTLKTKQGELTTVQGDVAKAKARLDRVENFRKSLDVKREEIRKLAKELQDTKGILTEDADVAGFMKSIITEAQQAGVTVSSLKPGETTKLEYVVQQNYDLNLSGFYIQILGFIDRLTKTQKILYVDNFSLKPTSRSDQKLVDLDGTFQVKSFRYLGGKADEIGQSPSTGGAAK